jgi:hypothetical protein
MSLKPKEDGNEAIKAWQRRNTLPRCTTVLFKAVTFPAVRNTMTTMKCREAWANWTGQYSLQHLYLRAVSIGNAQQNEATPEYGHYSPFLIPISVRR